MTPNLLPYFLIVLVEQSTCHFSYKKNVLTDLNIGSEADKSKVHTKLNISL